MLSRAVRLSRRASPAQLRRFSIGFDSVSSPGRVDLSGSTYLITGSTDGIGLNTATVLAAHNANVLVHGRSASRVQRAADQIRGHSGRDNVVAYTHDLSSLEAVREFAAAVKEDLPKLGGGITALINNAGAVNLGREETVDGLELTWAVNVAAHFLLTAELLPAISDRVVNVTSLSQSDDLDFEAIRTQFSPYLRNGLDAYGQAKLAMSVWTAELARRLEAAGSPVVALAVDPGTVHTKLLTEGWGSVPSYVGVDPADTYEEFFAAVDEPVRQQGGFVVGKKLRAFPKIAYDADAGRDLWDELIRQTGAMYSLWGRSRGFGGGGG